MPLYSHPRLGFGELAASDEFTYPATAMGGCSALLSPKWSVHTGGLFAGWSNIALTGNMLDIAMIYNPGGGTWSGGWIEGIGAGSFTPPYYVEANVQAPAVYGMWPGIYTWSAPFGTVHGVEVDFCELLGRTPASVPQTVHSVTSSLTEDAAVDSIGNWHVYGGAVYPDHVDFYIDGVLSNTILNTSVSGVINRAAPADFNIALTVGVCGDGFADCPANGPGGGTTATQHLYVDWIRAWVP